MATPLCAQLTGCAQPQEEAVAHAAVSSALQVNENGGVGKEVVEAVEDSCMVDPELAAQAAAARPSVAFIPSSCVEKTAEGNTLHAELTGCHGRFGRTTVEGGLDAVLESSGECLLHAEITDSGDLVANAEPLDYAASADVRVEPDHRKILWQAEWTGTTPRGRHIEQTSQLDIIATDERNCVDVAGVASGRVDRFDYELTIDELAVCPDECPSSGAVRASVDLGRRNRSLTITFDGSDAAQVTGWTGREFEVAMICRAVE